MKIKSLLLSLFFCFVCSSSGNATLNVGTPFFNPPFVLSLGEGFDVELMQLLCKGLQEECNLIPMDFDQLFTALNEGKIDIATGGIAIPAHSNKYIFSLPYMLCKAQFLTQKGSNINSLADLNGKSVGVIKGDPEGGVLTKYLLSTFQAQFEIKRYNDLEDLITDLGNNQISAAFLHRSSVMYWEQNGGGQFKAMGQAVTIGQGLGLMALPANAPLILRIDQQLQIMESNNTYLGLYNTYFANE